MPSGEAYWLPLIFMALMGVAFLVYAILDGYDLGVGILLPRNSEAQRDTMIASIGPFWDANETWLVLGVGIILIAFPAAHNVILLQLYIPVTLMLAGLILRGVAFDFRAKAPVDHKGRWDLAFWGGSLLATLSQGYMLGLYVMGFEQSWTAQAFALLSAVCVTAGYCLIGAAWLVMKTEGELQTRAARWARRCAWLMALGLVAVSLVNPMISERVFDRWLSDGPTQILLVIPLMCFLLFLINDRFLARFPFDNDFGCWLPFACTIGLFVLAFSALAYSFFPYVVPEQLTFWEAASAPESLRFILYGVVIVLPTIAFYTFYAYRVFWGKATELQYY